MGDDDGVESNYYYLDISRWLVCGMEDGPLSEPCPDPGLGLECRVPPCPDRLLCYSFCVLILLISCLLSCLFSCLFLSGTDLYLLHPSIYILIYTLIILPFSTRLFAGPRLACLGVCLISSTT